MTEYRAPGVVLFDLDGTLVDTAPDFHVVLNRILADAARPPVTYEQVRSQVSNGARALVTLGFGVTPEDSGFDEWLTVLLDSYEQRLAVDTCLFPGMAQVLEWLEQQALPWGVVTNKPERFTLPVLEGLGLLDRVGPVICPDHVQQRKPDPEGLLLACRQAGAPAEGSVYVGDHARDIEAGRRAGMLTVGALFGYLDEGEDPRAWQAQHYISRAEELLPLLTQHFSPVEKA